MDSTANTLLLDTDVWGILFLPGRRVDPRAVVWRAMLVGATVAIATQTRAEVLAGLARSRWSAVRVANARHQLDATATLPVDEAVIQSYADLTAWCQQSGHALHQKVHTGDRWIAASAAAHGLALVSGDGIFLGMPALQVIGAG